jgi:hypothetical protein
MLPKEVGPALFFSLLIITLLVRARLHLAGAGGTAVRAARLHQDLCDGGGGDPVDHAGSGADGLADPGQDSLPKTGQRPSIEA